MKIVVLAGGLSLERDVSLSSGCLVANALREAGHQALLIDLYENLNVDAAEYESLFTQSSTAAPYVYQVPENEPNLEELKQRNNNGGSLVGNNVLSLCQYADVVFMALHGAIGENGQIQALFDVLGIKYTGSGYFGSCLAMNKDLTKKLLCHAGLLTPPWLMFEKEMVTMDSIIEQIGLPCVVKPCSAGSSIGVSIAKSMMELQSAIALAEKYEDEILIEAMIAGREFSVGILGNKALPVIEIIPKEGFYDYKNKYQSGLTEEICPANLSPVDTSRLQELALKIHKVLQLGVYSRIDFIMDEQGQFYCLEANSLPGMTPTSLIPQEALAAGISYVDLCNRIVMAAVLR